MHQVTAQVSNAQTSRKRTEAHLYLHCLEEQFGYLREWIEGSACDPALAAANVISLQGDDVLEALLGERLKRLGGWSDQLVTAAVRRQLRSLESVAEAGGWWCSGLDPLADWVPMAWGCFKPNAPRRDTRRGRSLKYEHPAEERTRSFWLRVPAAVAARVAERFGLPLSPEAAADVDGNTGAFWRWWASELQLPLVITEGAKKAGALLSVGVPAVALPGVWNGAPKNSAGRPELAAELAGVPLKGRRLQVLFDWSDTDRGRRDVAMAYRRLGQLLKKAGAAEVLVGTCPGPAKGADDHLTEGGTWEQLEAELQVLVARPVVPWLRSADQTAPAGQWLNDACPIPPPPAARLVALRAPMGSGKTEAIAAAVAALGASEATETLRVVLVTHRRSLGTSLAARLQLPWATEGDRDDLQRGIALCVDSLSPASAMRFRPADWRGAVVIIDEVAQVLTHALMATGTAIAGRRLQVLKNLAELISNASQVIAADAQLSQPVLDALETMADCRALLINSENQPAAGRELVAHSSRESWRLALKQCLHQRQRVWISTSAQQAGVANSAQNLAALVQEQWPEARVLVVDSQTMVDPEHPAAQLASDPNGIAGRFDVVIASPAVAAGLSIDELPGHFATVFGWSGGTIDPVSVVQAVARVRDGCIRHVYAPERSPGNALSVASGATRPDQLITHLKHHTEAVAKTVVQLLAADEWNPADGTSGPWMRLWAKIAATQNAARFAYRSTVLELLALEGYKVRRTGDLEPQQQREAEAVGEQLKANAAAAQEREDRELIATPLISDDEAERLQKLKTQLNPAQRSQLQRWRIAKAWALQEAPPSMEAVAAHRDRLHRRLRFGWLVKHPSAAKAAALADGQRYRVMAQPRFNSDGPTGAELWAPDVCRAMEAPQVEFARGLGLHRWIERDEWFSWSKDKPEHQDADLKELALKAWKYSAAIRQLFGINIGINPTTVLRQLLRLVGYRLLCRRARQGEGRTASAVYQYRVERVPMPEGVNGGEFWATQQRRLGIGGTYLGSNHPGDDYWSDLEEDSEDFDDGWCEFAGCVPGFSK